jgi:LuxR family transcriptional regulator, maltose regulon positive regulatory protein
MPALLAAKHRPPPVRGRLVPRARLVRRLLGSSDLPVALLVAPPGYGKTTLLSQWARQDRRAFAWITLDDGDNAPGRLVAGIASALETGANTLEDLLSAIEARQRPFVLALDDAHVLRAPDAIRALAAIVEHLPAGSQLALATRHEPRMPVGRLRANRSVVELRSRDLAMTPSEAATLLRFAGVWLSAGDLAEVIRKTEGWAAGLYLAALAIREGADRPAAAAAFGGDHRLVADYLRDEVLDGLPRERITFMRCAAVLDSPSGAVCDAVLRRSGSGEVLASLERQNLLLFADAGDSYRYHFLLRDMLEAELRRSDPKLEMQLHRRAARWHADRGEPDHAVLHAVAAGDPGLAGEVLWPNFLRYVAHGRDAALAGWLGRFTDSQIADHPALALVAAGTRLVECDGGRVERWTAAAEGGLAGAHSASSLRGGVAVLRAAVDAGGLDRTRAQAACACDLLEPNDPWRTLSCFLMGAAHHLEGDREGARRLLEEGARHGAQAAPGFQALCLAQLALLALDEGDRAAASEHAARARSQVRRFGLEEQPLSALVLAVAATVQAEEGRVAEAKVDGRRAAALARRVGGDFAPWYAIEVRILLARTALRGAQTAEARSHLSAAAQLLRRSGGAGALGEWLRDGCARADSAAVSLVEERWSLTTAELRVLLLMPTHHSLPEIAARLSVSANTVKTHSRAVYRKLGASSRAEAVTQARSAGLIDAEPGALAAAA